MLSAWRIRHAAENQFRRFGRALRGQRVCVSELGGGTLDADDVELAGRLLARPSSWDDRGAVVEFETAFAGWTGTRHAFAFMGGRVALSACVHALGLGPGDEVILPGYTCVVVPNALRYAGVHPVYCDIELDTYGMDVAAARRAVTPNTRALLIHHLYGLVCRDYEALLALADEYGLKVIEDCAHATGAALRGRKVGTRGSVGFYSSERSKVFNTIQGGVAVTDDDAVSRRLREFCDQAPQPRPEFVERLLKNVSFEYYARKHPLRWLTAEIARLRLGDAEVVSTSGEEMAGRRPADYGMRMCGAVAQLGLNQLAKLDAYNARRRRRAAEWDRWCDSRGLTKPTVVDDSEPVFLRYPVMVDPALKAEPQWAAETLGVELGVWFSSHVHPTNEVVTGCPQADIAVATCVNFPCLP